MKYFLWFCLIGVGYAQIVPGPATGGGGGCVVSAGTTSCFAPTAQTVNIHVGDTIIAAFTANSTAPNPVVTGCNQTWPTGNRFTGTNFLGTIWVIEHASAAATNCQVSVTGMSGQNTFAWQVYSNTLSVGIPAINNASLSGAASTTIPVTAANVGTFIVGIFFITTTNPGTTAAAGTNLRRNVGNQGGIQSGTFIGDVAATSANQQITVGANHSVASTYRSATIELTAGVKTDNRVAAATDQMQTVLMGVARDMNYELPISGLPPTWCSWFMPTGSHVYELYAESSGQVNGLTGHIRMPSWQMTRICRDNSGNYWASPPLLAGTGISLAPSPSGITISSTGGAAGSMMYIAGGTTLLPAVSVPANDCATLYTSTSSTTPSAAGVLQSDVVSWSIQPGSATPGYAGLTFRPIAGADQVQWRSCNSGASAYTPPARDVNWYVARRSAGGFAAVHPKPLVHHKYARPKK